MRLIVGISGGSGVIYGIRLLQVLKKLNVESHLIITTAGRETIRLETSFKLSEVEALATENYRIGDIASKLSSGSFRTDGMVIIPASMKTVGGIASGYADNLLLRAAEVTLKERRPLVLVPRETPLNLIHLENMVKVTQAGAVVLPAMPAFYQKPKSVDDLVDHIVGKVLDILGVEHDLYRRWTGVRSE
ncbi:MAG: UbiX family flavin prenyltransferase [Nitrososphaerota archaeon]|nr:UbiX family flavin prenyltransferase [Nitrososphaerota archaeon]